MIDWAWIWDLGGTLPVLGSRFDGAAWFRVRGGHETMKKAGMD